MLNRKLLLIALFSWMSLVGLLAQQNIIHVHGTVTDESGNPQDSINILITSIYSDSTGVVESLYTDVNGHYEIDISDPPPLFIGTIEVSMVDCFGTLQTQWFAAANGANDFQADFVYCQNIIIDSCAVYIVEEWNPGALPSLTAYTYANVPVEYQWSSGDNTQTIYPNQSGTYCVDVIFPWGCTGSDCYDYIDSLGNCYSYITTTISSNGTYYLEVYNGGVYPFTHLWNTGETTDHIYAMGPGTYCVTSTDSTGCVSTTCVILDNPGFCEVYISEDPNGGLTAYGYGQDPLSYVWSTGDSTQTIYPPAQGTYCVVVTDQTGCSASSCYNYGNNLDSCYVYVVPLYIDSTTIALQAISGTNAQSVTYLWNTGDSTEIIYPQDPTLEYCVTVTDENGCVATGCFENSQLCYAWIDVQYIDTTHAVLTVFTDPIFGFPGANTATYLWSNGETSSVITVDSSGQYCVTATLGLNCVAEACTYIDFDSLQFACSSWVVQYQDTTTGQWYAEALAWGYGTFTYLWSNGDTNTVTPIATPNEYVCVTATSSFGCETTACTDTTFNPCQVYIYADYSSTGAVLKAYSWYGGAINSGTYLWSTGEIGDIITVTEEGTYCVTSSSSNGCTSEACIDVIFNVIDSCGVWISIDQNSPAGTAYTANAWGVPPFQYLWSNGATSETLYFDFALPDLCVTVTDAVGCVSNACTPFLDSCYVQLWVTPGTNSLIQIYSDQPIASVIWSTGDTTPWLQITEPGTYCAAVTNIWGCTATSCITIDTIDPSSGTNVISGFVFADSLLHIKGEVYVYGLESNSGQSLALIDSTQIDENSFYAFNDLPAGVYVIKAVFSPGTVGYLDFIPTYHLNTTTWEEATRHVLPNWLPVTTDIWMKHIGGSPGGGVIAGTVLDPLHIIAGSGDEERGAGGLPNVEVLLKNEAGEPINFVFSDAEGGFRFSNLALRTYRISYDIPGIHSPDVWVTLTAEDPERLQVTLIVNQGTTAVDQPEQKELSLYPNPAKDEINIIVPRGNSTFDIQVVDMQGRVVHTGSGRSINSILSLQVDHFSPGVYHINLKGENEFYYGRFLKLE